ncbi:MAG: 4Fe-4S dicluster domain-containing protein [Candidatus Diapherotrites archaeon]|nr:4Fe-4S dicluster domain-containing protein [Candidatus Diapherotrites archaeon]
MEDGRRLHWYGDRCIRCGLCVGICPFDALTLEDGMIKIDHDKCTLCGLCVKGCPVAALAIRPQLEEIARERGVSLEA